MKKIILLVTILLGASTHAAVITVDTNADDSPSLIDNSCSLREAVEAANSNSAVDNCVVGELGVDTIVFDVSVAGQTITLSGVEMVISDELIIDGGVDGITIDAENNSRIFNASEPLSIENLILINGEKFTGGTMLRGGAINTTADLTIINSILSNNSAANGGAIFVDGNISGQADLTIDNSEFSNNFASVWGGAIRTSANYNPSTSMFTDISMNIRITNSTFSENRSDRGGAIFNDVSVAPNTINAVNIANDVIITESTFFKNFGIGAGGAIFIFRNPSPNIVPGGSSDLIVFNSTLSDNLTNALGAAITLEGLANRLILKNSLLIGNRSSNGNLNNCNVSLPTSIPFDIGDSSDNILDANCIRQFDNVGLFGNLFGDLTFADILETEEDNGTFIPRLANNGCLIPAGGNNGSCVRTIALLPNGNSSINPAINNASLIFQSPITNEPIDTDQRGFGFNEEPDMGAFELGGGIPVTLTITPSVNGSVTSLTFPTSGFISSCNTTNSANCSADYAMGVDVMLAVEPNDDFTFFEWSGLDCPVSSLDINMDVDKTCEPLFISLDPTISGIPDFPVLIPPGFDIELADVSIADADSSQVSLMFVATNGTVLDNNDDEVTGLGSDTIANINSQISDLKFRPDNAGEASVAITVTDGSGNMITAEYDFFVQNSPGSVMIRGGSQTLVPDDQLSAEITDTNGLPASGIIYQWQDENDNIIATLNDVNTYTLTQAEVGKQIKVTAFYMDEAGSNEIVESGLTDVVGTSNQDLIFENGFE